VIQGSERSLPKVRLRTFDFNFSRVRLEKLEKLE